MITKRMHSRRRTALAWLALLSLAACSGSTSASASTAPAASVAAVASPPSVLASAASVAPSASPSTAPPASTAPSQAAATSGPTGVPTALDPCQLVTADEAGKLAGTTFGPGKESTTQGNGRICTYGAQTKNVFMVVVGVAPDAATAKKKELEMAAQAKAQANDLPTLTELPGFAPGVDAVTMEIPANQLNLHGTSIYAVKGAIFCGFSDLTVGVPAPTVDAMKAQLMTVIGRLP